MSAAPLALVTGGVRRVGAQISSSLAKAGYALALHGHSDTTPEDGLAEVLQVEGTEWRGFQQDFEEKGAADNLLKQIEASFGRLPDLIVNNASIFGQDDAGNIDDHSLERHLRVNMMVPTLLTTALANRISDGKRSAVVHILDQRIINPNRDQLGYTLSKQALAQSVRTLATACSDTLRVNGVAPGLTLTAGEYSDDQLANLKAMMPLDRFSSPQDIADAVLYLAGAVSVTGQIICVDGGANLKSYERDFVHLGIDP
ncbi:SDR family oxidoreductase [Parasphingorhabdus halotolerans]|uniref:SDR family oxidoreductase n=1 Tax=Parasphingorhabdus halotolerans TaxID=2725558 RepID=A0A6H2DNX9_9SPHN|nr:SDR family oxidoreductase [Parasphingorhabdus halotolerans]QJB70372.1 SDR family oxidoreductase [Parasphingorhabdus halotolerans]